jgi:hypothetical protein
MPDSPEHRVEMFNIASDRRKKGQPVWAYRLTSTRVEDAPFEENRDRFAQDFHDSSWFKAKGPQEGEPEYSNDLWQLWDEIKDAEDVDHFDLVLNSIYDAADYDRCWIQFIHEES